MIQINQLDRIPIFDYSDYAAQELRDMRNEIVAVQNKSEGIWTVDVDGRSILVAGIIRHSLLNPPRLWVLVTRAFAESNVIWHLRALRKVLVELDLRYQIVQTLVQADWKRGIKFARFCGFRVVETITDTDGKKYLVMER